MEKTRTVHGAPPPVTDRVFSMGDFAPIIVESARPRQHWEFNYPKSVVARAYTLNYTVRYEHP